MASAFWNSVSSAVDNVPASFSWARRRASSALAIDIASACSATSARTVTRSGSTSRNPPPTNRTCSGPPKVSWIRSGPGLRMVISGAWRARTPSSPSAPVATMNSTSPSNRLRSTLTTRTGYFICLARLELLDGCAFRRVVVLLTDDRRFHEPARRPERIHRGVDPDLDQRALETQGGSEVGEDGLDGRAGVGVGMHIHGLHRRDRPLAGRGGSLLQLAHLGRQRGLVADSRRHAAEQRGNLRSGEQVAKDVVDEQEHVGALFIAKVFGHGQACEADPCARARRFIHLAENKGGLRQHAGVLHLDVHVVALARSLPHSSEHRTALVLVGDVPDELLHDHCLAGAGTAEQADLRPLGEGAYQVDDLDPRFKDLDLRLLLGQRGCRPVDGPTRTALRGWFVVDRIPDHVEHAAQRLDANWHRDWRAGGVDGIAAADSVRGVHRDAAHDVVADV